MLNILIVDDDPGIRSLLVEVLFDEGFTINVTDNGARAVELARATHPDLILMDLFMPVMDGFTAAQRLKQDPGTRSTRIVAMSAQTKRIEATQRVWFDAVLEKPFDIDRLIKVVHESLGAAGIIAT